MSTKYDGTEIAYTGISLVGQTLVFGSYASIFPLAVYIYMKNRRLQHLESQVMFALMIFTFTLSTSFWAISVATYSLKIETIAIDQVPEFARPVNSLPTIGNVVILLNLICTDVVVLWRAFTICQDLGQARMLLIIASLCLSICTLLVFGAVGIRAVIILIHYDIINGIADTAPFAFVGRSL